MIEQFQHRATTSFLLWFDNYLLRRGQAFSNQTGSFSHYTDDRLDGRYKAFGSKYKQWVTDSSIDGAIVPSGVWVNGSFKQRGNDLKLDFDNGRALLSGVSNTAAVTGSFSVKDFNIYFTNEGEEDLLVDKKYESNSRTYIPSIAYVQPYDQVVPAIFISSESMRNEPFAFGGEDTTQISMKAVVLSDSAYHLDGVLSIFADSREEVIPNIPFSGHPIDEYGDLKNGTYSYQILKTENANNQLFFIEDVVTSKLTDKARKSLANDLYVGFIDFEIHQQRSPRA